MGIGELEAAVASCEAAYDAATAEGKPWNDVCHLSYALQAARAALEKALRDAPHWGYSGGHADALTRAREADAAWEAEKASRARE